MAYCENSPPKAWFPGFIATMAMLIATTGCYTSHVRTPSADASDVHLNRALEAVPTFRYDKVEVPFTNHVEGSGATDLYELRLLEIPSIGENGQKDNLVTAKYFRSIVPGSHPLIIVLPIWGTYTYPPRKVSSSIQRLSDGAAHVLSVQGEHYLADWSGLVAAEDENEFLEKWREAVEHQRVTMIDVSRLIDWAEERPEIDARRVGLVGFSLGAMIGGTIATQEPRLAATVLAMGGAHTQTIITHCTGKRTTSVQEKAATFGWSQDDFEAQVTPLFLPIDPASYPGRVDPSRILLFEAARDTCVPEDCRVDLWEALGRPEKITLDYGHHKAFLSITPLGNNWMRRQIWEFFETKLLPASR